MDRNLPPTVQKMFDSYTENFARRLTKDKAIKMFQTEYKLSPERSEIMFKMFDKDRNNMISVREFYIFYTSFGDNTNEYLDSFNSLLMGDTETVDISGCWDFLKQLKTMSGRTPSDEELEQSMKAMAGDERSIDMKKFVELVGRIKLMRS